MAAEYSVTTCRILEQAFRSAEVLRPMRIGRYDSGRELTYEVTGISPAATATVRVEVCKFVGGGFAGQVYRVKVVSIDGDPISGLTVGGYYAMKILIPPSNFSRKFRDAIYKIGFQGDFSLQVNPAAARAGAIWQKLIRRGAKIRFGTEKSVVDVLGTFFDETLGSCGEISEWIDGRNWQFEVDENLGQRRRWCKGGQYKGDKLGSQEYRAKKTFMADLVALLHEMGAPELARQYEWWTAKSQPNVLKRLESDGDADSAAGLTAVDFRAGLALLPVLPMSPADVKLIFKGIARGSLVQFDRGNLKQLRRFIDTSAEDFADMNDSLEELEVLEREYRRSLPDIAHHHVRLLYDGRLWGDILDGAVTGWRAKGLIDDVAEHRLRRSRFLTVAFAALGLLGMLSVAAGAALLIVTLATGALTWTWGALAVGLIIPAPIILRLLRSLLGRGDLRRHYAKILTSGNYLHRAILAHMAETLIDWCRSGRISSERARRLLTRPARFLAHAICPSWMPAGLHRILTDKKFAIEKLRYIFVRPIRLFFNADAREQWLRDMVAEGRKKHMLSDEDAERILARVKEPFIQKYLKALAVHVCTLPVTQIVSVAIAIIYVLSHPEMPRAQAWGIGAGIIVLFQVIPISPGSLTRGLYVVYLVIRDRDFRSYNIAVFLGFFKYVGYLAFPIQMAYHYPALARFMAGHWATEAVHIVPVFGEHGALLEHGVFDLFYNRPLTIRRQMRIRAEQRSRLRTRIWHVAPIIIVATILMGLANLAWTRICMEQWVTAPVTGWMVILLATVLAPLLAGAAVTGGAGRMSLPRRVALSAVCGAVIGAVSGVIGAVMLHYFVLVDYPVVQAGEYFRESVGSAVLHAFIFALLAVIGTLVTEINLPEPKTDNHLRQ
ncbi:MAG: hypothetical protein SVV80_04190 [Planctomycetota bacterium]|nr:hypothetical protein [Planctomycetota bacterium]